MEEKGIKITSKGIEPLGSLNMNEAYGLLYDGLAHLTETMVTNYCKDKNLDPTSLDDTKEIRKILHDDIVLNISYICNKLYPDDSNKQESA